MRTLALEVNWLFYGLVVLFIYLLRVTFQAFSLPDSVIQLLTFVPLVSTGLVLYLSLSDKRFLHVDKAGVSYKCGFKTRYLHREQISSIKCCSLLLIEIPVVQLTDGKQVYFFSWRIDKQARSKALALLS